MSQKQEIVEGLNKEPGLKKCFFFFLMFIFERERERESMSRGGAERGGDTESEAGSKL